MGCSFSANPSPSAPCRVLAVTLLLTVLYRCWGISLRCFAPLLRHCLTQHSQQALVPSIFQMGVLKGWHRPETFKFLQNLCSKCRRRCLFKLSYNLKVKECPLQWLAVQWGLRSGVSARTVLISLPALSSRSLHPIHWG